MRQFLGGISALLLSTMLTGVGYTAESPLRPASEEIEFAETAFRENNVAAGLIALQRASDLGSLNALLRIAAIHEKGELVPSNWLKACQTYSIAADRYSRVDRFYPSADLVATAFRKLANCYAKGFGSSEAEPNMSAAADLYFHAGVLLQDPEGMFELAKLYLTGSGILQNTTMAIRLLDSAARKQHPPAQALLGSMMWDGKVMKRQAAQGLALLILGRERTAPENRAWILSLYDDAIIVAPKEIEAEAMLLVEKWKTVHGEIYQTIATSAPATEVPAPSKSPTRQLGDLDYKNGTDKFQNQNTNIQLKSPVVTKPNR